MMKTTVLATWCGCGALALVPRLEAAEPPASPKPNILLVFMDDLGWRDTGFMGSRYYETPRLDAFAKEGMVLTSAYVTAPSCTPSRAGLITGWYTPRTGIYRVNSGPILAPDGRDLRNAQQLADWAKLQEEIKGYSLDTSGMMNKTLPSGCVAFPELLRKAGYRTGIVGKWHHAPGPEALGFDEVISTADKQDRKNDPKQMFSFTTAALDFMKRNKDRPFFFYLSHHTPHVGLQSRPATLAKYQKKEPVDGQTNRDYAAMIEDTDTSVGILLDGLRDLGLADNTIVIFFSDNGGWPGVGRTITDNAPLRAGKGTLYEGGIRVPLAIRWPGRIALGTRCDEPVTGADLYPTFLEMAGAAPDPRHAPDGLSLVPLLTGGGALPERAVFWHEPVYNFGNMPPCSALRMGKYKLIDYLEDGKLELYDLEQDIGEKTDLAQQDPATTKRLHDMLKAWRKASDAPIPPRQKPVVRMKGVKDNEATRKERSRRPQS